MKKPYDIIKIDKNTRKIQMPNLLLMNRSFSIIGKISKYDNWNISLVGNGIDEISFDVHKYSDGELCPIWDELIDLKIVDVRGFGRFEISVDYTDNTETVKSVHGLSLETELAQIGLYEFHVNDEEATDMEITEYSKDNYDKDGNFIPTTFYNPEDEKHSLLHRVLADKAPHWSIGHVTKYIALDEESQRETSSTFQRTYTVDGDSIYDFLTGTVAEESNVIFLFDTTNRIINCYSLCDCMDKETGDIQAGIGEDTTVFVSKNKLANEITISSNKDNVKNCFRIEGGDDVITDMVRAVNMNGSNYIYQFADFQYHDMPEALVAAIKQYNEDLSKKADTYYGNGDMNDFINGTLTLQVTSELEAATALSICKNNRITTNNVNISNYTTAPYWYVVTSGNSKELYFSKTAKTPNKTVTSAFETMGIYSRLCAKYDELAYFESSMMPNTDIAKEPGKAEEQYNKVIEKLNKSIVAVSSMDNYTNTLFTGVTNNIEAYAQIFIDSRFDLEIIDKTTTYSYTKGNKTGTWEGKIRITQHTNKTNVYPADDSSVSELRITVNADELTFTRQKIEKALSKGSMLDIDFDVAKMNDEDGKEIHKYFNKYCLNRLQSFYDGYDSCLSILMKLDEKSPVYKDMYGKYSERRSIVSDILKIRQEQIAEIEKNIRNIEHDQEKFQKTWDFRNYLEKAGKDFYKIFCSYRREDTYTNSNYISDGLSDAECLAKAKELVGVATKEAKKACVLQRTVSTSLNNLFALPEFEPFYDKFALFNYIRIRTEDEILKLRLIGVEFNGDSAQNIQVTFSEQIESVDGKMSDLQSIIKQAGSMATSFSSTALQAKKGEQAKNAVLEMYHSGLNAAKTMLSNNDNNEVTITSAGIECKRMDDEGFYGDKQLRLTGNMIAFTNNAWKDVNLAIGETTFKNPANDEEKQAYGIIAENIVGKMIAGENMYIGNKTGSVQLTGDGITISNGVIKSSNYINNGNGNETGSIIDLRYGTFSFANGCLTYNGDMLSVKGAIEADKGKIANFDITTDYIFADGIYFGRNGLKITGILDVKPNGKLDIGNGKITYDSRSGLYIDGNIKANSLNVTNCINMTHSINGKTKTIIETDFMGDSQIEDGITFPLYCLFNNDILINKNLTVDGESTLGDLHVVAEDNIEINTENQSIKLSNNNASVILYEGEFRPTTDCNGGIKLGRDSARWKEIWCSQSSINSSSDRNLKNSIEYMDKHDKIKDFFLSLSPCTYKFNDGESGRTHFGFISQDVEQALFENNMSAYDFAGFCKDIKTEIHIDEDGKEYTKDILSEDGEPEYIYSLRYGEFIALNTFMIQELYRENQNIKSQLKELQLQIERLKQ